MQGFKKKKKKKTKTKTTKTKVIFSSLLVSLILWHGF